MATSQSRPLDVAALIGRNLRRVRETIHRWTQAELTDRLRAFGLDWNRSQVAKAERGERVFTFEQVALIAAALGIGVAELVQDQPGERVALSAHATCDPEFLVALFDATPPAQRLVELPHLDCPQTRRRATNAKSVVVAPTPTEAEERLARALGTKPDVVGQAAHALWQRSFVEERELRLTDRIKDGLVGTPPPALPRGKAASAKSKGEGSRGRSALERDQEKARSIAAQRGHVTRGLLAELRPALGTSTESRTRTVRKNPSRGWHAEQTTPPKDHAG